MGELEARGPDEDAAWYSSCLSTGMAYLADSPAQRPSVERSDWLVVAALAVLLTTLCFLPGLADRDRTTPPELGVCERQSFSAANLFFLALH